MLMILLAGFGLWLCVEGLIYAVAPETMQRFGAWLAALSEKTIRQAGLLSIALGAVLLYIMVRFNG